MNAFFVTSLTFPSFFFRDSPPTWGRPGGSRRRTWGATASGGLPGCPECARRRGGSSFEVEEVTRYSNEVGRMSSLKSSLKS